MPEPILQIKNLSRSVTDNGTEKKIVNNISYNFYPQKIYTLIGPSGAGKSSLLRLINRLDESTSGEILYHNQSHRALSPCKLRHQIGYLFQTPYLFEGSVRDNLLYADSSLDESKLKMLLSLVQLPSDFLNNSESRLSGGEKQRVALARLLATKPEVILLDEPTSALDPAHTEAIEKLIIEIVEFEKLTALVVTHDPHQALRIGAEILLMVNGSLVESGTGDDVINNPKTDLGKKFKARKLK